MNKTKFERNTSVGYHYMKHFRRVLLHDLNRENKIYRQKSSIFFPFGLIWICPYLLSQRTIKHSKKANPLHIRTITSAKQARERKLRKPTSDILSSSSPLALLHPTLKAEMRLNWASNKTSAAFSEKEVGPFFYHIYIVSLSVRSFI